MSSFSERLKSLREAKKEINKKWTQQYVADRVGVARGTYTGYERGTKTPPIETINRIADLFEVTTDYLSGRSNEMHLSESQNKDLIEIQKLIEKLSKEGQHEKIENLKSYTKWLANDLSKDKN